MPRAKAPKLTTPAERRELTDVAAELDFAPALAVLRIARGDKRWPDAGARLRQVAANYRLAAVLEAEETPARQIATLKAARKRMKDRAKQGPKLATLRIALIGHVRVAVLAPDCPGPFFVHPSDDKRRRHRAALPMSLEMAIGRELNAIERATPGLSTYAKQVAALDAAIDRLDARRRNSKGVSRGRKQDWPLLFMFDQLVDVTHHLDPSITEPRDRERKRLRKFIRAFMVAMGMKPQRRLRADRLLPERRKVLLKTEQAQVDAARWREIDKQNDQTIELLSKLSGPMQPPHWSRSQLITRPRLPPRSGH